MRVLGIAVIAALSLVSEQMFRVGVDGVRVDVLVMDGNRPVAGLTVNDFELRDAGVRQEIASVEFEEAPLSVMLALDTSQSVDGEPLSHLKEAAHAAATLLLPRDRVALLTFSSELDLRADWSADRARLAKAIDAATAGGATSLHDAAYAALTLRDPAGGRALVLLFSDGEDTISWLAGQTVLDVLRRADAVVYGIGIPRDRVPGFRVDVRSGLQPDMPNVPAGLLMQSFLQALADESGGKYLEATSTARLRQIFEEVVREFRTRYLLTYTPRGVETGGWHPIEVKLKGGHRGTVTARRGYLR